MSVKPAKQSEQLSNDLRWHGCVTEKIGILAKNCHLSHSRSNFYLQLVSSWFLGEVNSGPNMKLTSDQLGVLGNHVIKIPFYGLIGLCQTKPRGPDDQPCTGKELALLPTLLSQEQKLLSLTWETLRILSHAPYMDVFKSWLTKMPEKIIKNGLGYFMSTTRSQWKTHRFSQVVKCELGTCGKHLGNYLLNPSFCQTPYNLLTHHFLCICLHCFFRSFKNSVFSTFLGNILRSAP